MEPIKKILFCEGRFFAWKKGDLHTAFGMLKEQRIKKAKVTLESNIGKRFKILKPTILDLFLKAQRGPQIILPKDIGLILLGTGIDKHSIVLEAGTGSGFLTCHLARFVKKVISYERRNEFLKIAKNNAQLLGLKNITFKEQDVYKEIKEKNLDLVVLDVSEPEKAADHALHALKQGGYFVVYLPTINQVMHFLKNIEQNFFVLKVVELLERQWHVEQMRVRPQSHMIAHTGFLCFLRKV